MHAILALSIPVLVEMAEIRENSGSGCYLTHPYRVISPIWIQDTY